MTNYYDYSCATFSGPEVTKKTKTTKMTTAQGTVQQPGVKSEPRELHVGALAASEMAARCLLPRLSTRRMTLGSQEQQREASRTPPVVSWRTVGGLPPCGAAQASPAHVSKANLLSLHGLPTRGFHAVGVVKGMTFPHGSSPASPTYMQRTSSVSPNDTEPTLCSFHPVPASAGTNSCFSHFSWWATPQLTRLK